MNEENLNISELYESNQVNGWLGEDVAKEQWDWIKTSSSFVNFSLSPPQSSSQRMMLYDVVRKVLGKDTENYPQQIGDCVSFGMKNAIEYLQCCEILLKGDFERFRPIFPPYLYGTGRIYVGGGRLGNSDGSLGSWMADAVVKYGTIPSDEEGVPKYSGSVAKSWGGPNGKVHLDKWKELGQKHLGSAAKINNWDELVAAICNGYPVTIASNQGFVMEADSEGFHAPRGTWNHQMAIIGVDNEHRTPYAIILNSWGDAHGKLKDFKTNEDLPIGCLRVKKGVVERMIRQGETFAISNLDGFEERPLDKALFKLI